MKNILRIIRELLYDIVPHDLLMKIYFRMSLNESLNLKQPKTFNEKICWYKLRYCANNDLIIKCADKNRMREYFFEKGLEQNLVPQIGLWEDAHDINFDYLPDKFVLKTNHGCHFNIVCTDKKSLNKEKAIKILNSWLKIKYGKLNIEPHYDKIKPMIIGEKYVGEIDSGAVDYKLHCFNGKPSFFEICHSRVINGDALSSSYDCNWNKMNLYKYGEKDIEKPICLSEMLDIATKIAIDFPYVRIDFYVLDKKPLIGELTFSPAGGMDRDLTLESDIKIGEKFDITKIKS